MLHPNLNDVDAEIVSENEIILLIKAIGTQLSCL